MPDVDTIIRSLPQGANAHQFLHDVFDEIWKECDVRFAHVPAAQRERARERLASFIVLISTDLTSATCDHATDMLERLQNTVCDTDFLIGPSRVLDFSRN